MWAGSRMLAKKVRHSRSRLSRRVSSPVTLARRVPTPECGAATNPGGLMGGGQGGSHHLVHLLSLLLLQYLCTVAAGDVAVARHVVRRQCQTVAQSDVVSFKMRVARFHLSWP